MEQGILERVAAGERTAVADCLDRYGGLVWSLALRLCADRTEAEDAVQEIFIDLWSNAGRFDAGVATEATFISMIARRRLIDRLRKRRREPDREDLDAVGELGDPAPQQRDLETRDEAARAARALAALKPEQQKVLDMSIYQGLTHAAIAQKLSLPLGTVKTHLRRGLIRIREQLGVPMSASGGEAPS